GARHWHYRTPAPAGQNGSGPDLQGIRHRRRVLQLARVHRAEGTHPGPDRVLGSGIRESGAGGRVEEGPRKERLGGGLDDERGNPQASRLRERRNEPAARRSGRCYQIVRDQPHHTRGHMRSAGAMIRLAAACAAFSAAAYAGPGAAQDWKPSKTVEIVVGSSPGGSPDVMARLVQRIFQGNGLVPTSTVVNKPGAANTIGWAYLNQHAGDAHYIATFSPALIGNRIMGTTQLTYTDFTPLNILAREYVVLAVRADSPIASLKDL